MDNPQALAPLVVVAAIAYYFDVRPALEWLFGIVAANPWFAGLILAAIIATAIGRR